jgi:hypothetical protein
MQTEITTEYIRRLQQNFREEAWSEVLGQLDALSPNLPTIHSAFIQEVKKQPSTNEYAVLVGSVDIQRLSKFAIEDAIKEEFLKRYSAWMDRYIPCGHVEVKRTYKALELYIVIALTP